MIDKYYLLASTRLVNSDLHKFSPIVFSIISGLLHCFADCIFQVQRVHVMQFMVEHMHHFLRDAHLEPQETYASMRRLVKILQSIYLITLYFISKMLYIANVLAQLSVMNHLLGTNYSWYGMEMLVKLMRGESWATSDTFPRVTFCDFWIRVVGHSQRYTVQCALPANLLNEMIYTFLWFWYVFVCICTAGSFFIWFGRIVFLPGIEKYITTRLIAGINIDQRDPLDEYEAELVQQFIFDYLRRDGIFIMFLVAKNTSDVIAAEFICSVFKRYDGPKPHPLIERHYQEDF